MMKGDESKETAKAAVTQRGMALIAVVGALAMTAVVTAEFSTDATVDYEAAANVRDNMRAQVLARSAMNISRLVIKVQTSVIDRYSKQLQSAGLPDIQLADYLPMFMGAFGGGKEEVTAIGEAIGVGGDAIKGLGLPEGSFSVAMTTDDGKINVNCANTNNEAEQRVLQTKLQALVYADAYERLFERAAADGWRRTRDEQVAAIIDYIDRDTAQYTGDSNGSRAPEDYGYQQLDDRYKAKNNYIDTVGEIKLIRGMDDRMWTLLGSAFTVYGDCKQNLGAMQDVNVVLAIIMSAAKEGDPVAQDVNKVWRMAQFVAQARQLQITFKDAADFVKFVAGPAEYLGGEEVLAAMGIPLPLPEGIDLDQKKLNQVAVVRARRTYRVEASATIGRVTKTITAVWDKEPVRQNRRPRDKDTKGAWVFWKEE